MRLDSTVNYQNCMNMSKIDSKLPAVHESSVMAINHDSGYDADWSRLLCVYENGELLVNIPKRVGDDDEHRYLP